MPIADDKKRISVTIDEATTRRLDVLAELLDLSPSAAAGIVLEGLPDTDRGLKLLATKLRKHRGRDIWTRGQFAARRRALAST